MSRQRKKKKIKLPKTIWIIRDDVDGRFWGPEGWVTPPGEIFLFETFLEADEAFAMIPNRLFGAEIMEMNTDDI